MKSFNRKSKTSFDVIGKIRRCLTITWDVDMHFNCVIGWTYCHIHILDVNISEENSDHDIFQVFFLVENWLSCLRFFASFIFVLF